MTRKRWMITGVTVLCIVLLVLVGFVVSKKDYRMVLLGEDTITIEVFGSYEEQGTELYINDKLSDELVTIDDSNLNLELIGEYKINYNYLDKENLNLSRTIIVVDTVAPELKLIGADIEITEGDEYKDPGFSAVDAYDGDITDQVTLTGTVDPKTVGDYTIKYDVKDSSGNDASASRKVTVIEKIEEPVIEVPSGGPSNGGGSSNNGGNSSSGGSSNIDYVGKDTSPYTGLCKVGDGATGPNQPTDNPLSPAKTPSNSSNEVMCFTFINQGISIQGIHNENVASLGLMASNGEVVKTFDTSKDGAIYNSNMDLIQVANGSYTLVSPSLGNAKIVNKFNADRRIVQAQIGKKLVKVSYPDNTIKIDVSDFSYKYDIAINVGHGGTDGGSSGNGQSEKTLNLMVSAYEKKRFEDHGLKVYMSRTTDSTYGDEAGPSSWPRFRRSAYSMGLNASVSRLSYSNHHNSTGGNASKSGWEILVNARASKSDLAVEHNVGNGWNGVYGRTMTGATLYTKHYYKANIHNKASGQVYDFIDWYGMQRVTDMLFNEFVPTYEHIYLSNAKDVSWYMGGKWKDMAEVKVKAYVEALGKTYVAPKN